MILFIILLVVPFTYQLCENLPDVDIDRCCRNVTTWECDDRESGIVLDIIDDTNGVAELKFNLLCMQNVMQINLYVYEMNGTQCGNKSTETLFYDDYNRHTVLSYRITDDNSTCPDCETVGKIEFSYIFTGCYYVYIPGLNMETSPGFYLQTKYKKLRATDSKESLYSIPRDNKELILIFKHELFKMNNLIIDFEEKLSGTTQFRLYDTDGNEENHNLNVCKISGDDSMPNPTCLFMSHGSSLECKFKDVPKGVYKFRYKILNEPVRCNPKTLWNDKQKIAGYDPCLFEYNDLINITDVMSNSIVDDEDDGVSNALIFSSIACFIILVVIGVCIVIICRKNSHRWRIERIESTNPPSVNKPKIFLLYAKDCRQFMDMMEAFRTVLTIDGKFEVFDIYDKIRMVDIAVDPENWILDKLMNCKIILILSECAAIQKNYTRRNKPNKVESLYIIPSCEDNYFMYSFGCLEKDPNNETYDKLYVANLGFDQKSYESFKYINTHTRYCVPEHLPQLISDLNNEQISNEERRILLEETCAVKTFLKKYREYEEYLNMRPNYLENILHVQTKLIEDV